PVTVTRTLEHSEKAKLYLNRIAGKKNPRVKWDYRFHSDSINPKSATLTSALHKGCPYNVLVDRRFSDSLERWGLRGTGLIRKFHIIELERLQTFPDGWTDGAGVCMTNRLYALGNAVTVSVVEYILGFMTAAVATA
ncbi:DNA cytosine methyltransferase, partial [Candidatus Woesearchaeota archaeon]|nr:DNA cytosine methyltransferase [Candidatus Woesearchaeota archaeon]